MLVRHLVTILSIFLPTVSFGQLKSIVGTFTNPFDLPKLAVTFNADSTFSFASSMSPNFYSIEDFSERGQWTLSGDTIILNSKLTKKIFVQSEFIEQDNFGGKDLSLTLNHIKRYFDTGGNVMKADTFQVEGLYYAFNEQKRKNWTRVGPHRLVKCSFAGPRPREIITTNRTISVNRPTENLKRIFIGCFESGGTKEFIIKNPNSNHLTFNVYSNYYLDGQIRQMKFLIKDEKVLYTKQKENGEFEKDNIWAQTNAKLIRQKGGS
jgi:hypothetical protein